MGTCPIARVDYQIGRTNGTPPPLIENGGIPVGIVQGGFMGGFPPGLLRGEWDPLLLSGLIVFFPRANAPGKVLRANAPEKTAPRKCYGESGPRSCSGKKLSMVLPTRCRRLNFHRWFSRPADGSSIFIDGFPDPSPEAQFSSMVLPTRCRKLNFHRWLS